MYKDEIGHTIRYDSQIIEVLHHQETQLLVGYKYELLHIHEKRMTRAKKSGYEAMDKCFNMSSI
jgi:hypothetical protein